MLKSVKVGTYVWTKIPVLNGIEHALLGNLGLGELVIVYDDDNNDSQYCMALTRFGVGSVLKASFK